MSQQGKKTYSKRSRIDEGNWTSSAKMFCVVEYEWIKDATNEVTQTISYVPVKWVDRRQRLLFWPPKEEVGDALASSADVDMKKWRAYSITRYLYDSGTEKQAKDFYMNYHTTDVETDEDETQVPQSMVMNDRIPSPKVSNTCPKKAFLSSKIDSLKRAGTPRKSPRLLEKQQNFCSSSSAFSPPAKRKLAEDSPTTPSQVPNVELASLFVPETQLSNQQIELVEQEPPPGYFSQDQPSWQFSVKSWITDLSNLNLEILNRVNALSEKVELLEHKVHAIGRKLEPEDSAFFLAKLSTPQQFLAAEETLRDPEQFQLQVARIRSVGCMSTLGRTVTKIFQMTLSPDVYRNYSMCGKKRNDQRKLPFKDTLFFKSLTEAILGQPNASFKADIEMIRQATMDVLRKAGSKKN